MEIAVLLHTTFGRFENAKKTIKSFTRMGFKVYVSDTGELTNEKMDWYKDSEERGFLEYYYLGWDTSPAITRNFLIDKIKEPFVWKIDDDFLIDKTEKLGEICELLQSQKEIGICCLKVASEKQSSQFIYNVELKEKAEFNQIKNPEIKQFKNIKYHHCDIGPDCWIARRDIFPLCNYDERYHVSEGLHPDFFLQIKHHGIKTIYTDSVEVYHTKWAVGNKIDRGSFYQSKRFRNRGKTEKFCEKWGVKSTNKI